MGGDGGGMRANAPYTRRRLVLAGVAITVVLAAFYVLRSGGPLSILHRAIGQDFSASNAEVRTYEIESELTGGVREEIAILPATRSARPPLLLLFHGRGGQSMSWADDAMLAALDRQGKRAPVVVSVDGGDHSYYHDRDDGQWDSYVMNEVIPDAVERFGVDPQRIVVGGHSMGGFGALNLAMRHPGRFCAAGGHEPAIWRTGGETAPGAFDDAEDFARNDLVGTAISKPKSFGSTKLWLDRGDRDYFIAGDEAFIAALRSKGTSIKTRVWPGDHGTDYLWPHIDEPVAFYAKALADCEPVAARGG
ncbi:MAG: alpha/beta fold hydrolase [Candidatus Nanopelagicales bacterium]|nr:alpha/beta fold hydrolase [Candidatus Nanopelagicales bacterium]